jgi:hypothetical protein
MLRVTLAAIIAASPALAQTPSQCAPRDRLLAHLATKYDESPRAVGLAANSTLMEVFASEASGTWTITVTTPQGLTCMIASGTGYEPVAAPAPGVPG